MVQGRRVTDEETLEVAADGSVEVVLGPTEQPGNWIETDVRAR